MNCTWITRYRPFSLSQMERRATGVWSCFGQVPNFMGDQASGQFPVLGGAVIATRRESPRWRWGDGLIATGRRQQVRESVELEIHDPEGEPTDWRRLVLDAFRKAVGDDDNLPGAKRVPEPNAASPTIP